MLLQQIRVLLQTDRTCCLHTMSGLPTPASGAHVRVRTACVKATEASGGTGAQAALGAGMRCIVTYTSSTSEEEFEGAERVFGDLPEALTLDHLRAPPTAGSVSDSRREGHQLT